MKYLNPKLYENACSINDDKSEHEWNKQYDKYTKIFNKFSSDRLPKDFCDEYSKYHFHDNIITSFNVFFEEKEGEMLYNILMNVKDYHNENIQHSLTFVDVNMINATVNFVCSSGSFDWLYSEILPINKKRMSFELFFYSDSLLYFEFKELKYNKTLITNS